MHRERPHLRRAAALLLPLLMAAAVSLIPQAAYASVVTANQLWSNLTGRYVIAVPDASTSNGVQLET